MTGPCLCPPLLSIILVLGLLELPVGITARGVRVPSYISSGITSMRHFVVFAVAGLQGGVHIASHDVGMFDSVGATATLCCYRPLAFAPMVFGILTERWWVCQ